MSIIQGGTIEPDVESAVFSLAIGSPAAPAAASVLAAVTDNGAAQTISTGFTNPDAPRNVTATAGGTTGNITAVQVVVNGFNALGIAISETLPAFTAATGGIVTGSKAFAKISSIVIPHNGTGVTTSIGLGSKLGLKKRLSRNSVLNAFLNGVKEATAPTVAFNATALESNTVTLNSTLAGEPVIVDVIVP